MGAQSSIFSDLSGYVERVAKLVKLDVALLSIETKASLQSIAISLGMMAAAAAFALLGLIVLLFAAVLLLIQLGVAPSLAALIVAVVLFVAAGALIFIGLGRLKTWTLTPRRTIAQFSNNLEALRASLQHDTNG